MNGHEAPTADADGSADAGAAETRRGRRRAAPTRSIFSRHRTLFETLIGLAVAILIAFGVRTYFLQAYYVPSSSMEPTLQIGDRILVDKFDFNYHSITPGDIVVFRTPPIARSNCLTEDGDLVKRVVATGGETIRSSGNEVFVKAAQPHSKWELLSQSYFPDNGLHTPLGQEIIQLTVPKNDFFVLGDNRTVSCDSRVWGFLPGRDIVGRVIAVIWRHWHPDLIIF
jgi:signal peptidase I